MNRWYLARSRMLSLLIWVTLCFSVALPVYAAWYPIMTETFETASRNWTWRQPQTGTPIRIWQVTPWPYMQLPHWGIENRIYRPDQSYPERYVQAAWCDASTDPTQQGAGRSPEFDFYRPNMHTVMWWGPVDTRGMHNLRVQFDWINNTVVGDTFFWEATSNAGNPIAGDYRSRWFQGISVRSRFDSTTMTTVYDTTRTWHRGQADIEWRNGSITIDSLDSAGTIISIAGRNNIYFGWRFKSHSFDTSAVHRLGPFVDNVRVAYDDGLFDLAAMNCTHLISRDSSYAQFPQVLDTLTFRLRLNINGAGALRDTANNLVRARVTCKINNMAYWDTLVAVDALEGSNTVWLYSPHFVPQIEGRYRVCWKVDADTVVHESSETNNSCCDDAADSTGFMVIQPNMPPMAQFLSLNDADTVRVMRIYGHHAYYGVIADVRDVDNIAEWYLYISQDSALGSGTVYDTYPGFPRQTHDGADTINVDYGALSSGGWYFSVFATDNLNNPIWVRARACLFVEDDPNEVKQEPTNLLPTTNCLKNAYPNPFNSEVILKIGLKERLSGVVTITDIMGREVDRLQLPVSAPGWHDITWRPSQLSSGVYFARFITKGQVVSTIKLSYVK